MEKPITLLSIPHRQIYYACPIESDSVKKVLQFGSFSCLHKHNTYENWGRMYSIIISHVYKILIFILKTQDKFHWKSIVNFNGKRKYIYYYSLRAEIREATHSGVCHHSISPIMLPTTPWIYTTLFLP